MLKQREFSVTAMFDGASTAGGIAVDTTAICGIVRALYVDFPASGADASTALSVKTESMPQALALSAYTADNGDGWLYPVPLLHKPSDGATTHYDDGGSHGVADTAGGIPVVNEKLLLQFEDSDGAGELEATVTILYEEKDLAQYKVILFGDGYDDNAGATKTIADLTGYVWAIYCDYTAAADTPALEIKTVGDTARTILAVSGKTDGWFYPRMLLHDASAAALTFDTGKSVYEGAIPLLNDTVSVGLTAADNMDTVKVTMVMATADIREVEIDVMAELGNDGAAAGMDYITGVTGKLLSVEIEYNDAPATTDVTIATDEDYGNYPDSTILTVSNNNTDGYYQPRGTAVDSSGTAWEYESGDYVAHMIPLIEAGVKVSIAQADASSHVKVKMLLER